MKGDLCLDLDHEERSSQSSPSRAVMVTVSDGPRSDRMTRAERRRTSLVVKRRIKCMRQFNWEPKWVEEPRRVGSCRSRHPFDCGHAKCWTCNCLKFPRRYKTDQEIKNDLNYREEIKSLYGDDQPVIQ